MTLPARLQALIRLFVAACVGSAAEVDAALQAARAAGAAPKDVDETLLLVVAYAGVPRAILAFTAWRRLEPAVSDVPAVADRRAAGDRAFDAVYGARSRRIRDELLALHPALREAILEDAYGRILARCGLSAQDRELLAVGMLVALAAPRQAAAHAIGARRAGATDAAILDAAGLAAPYRTPAGIAEARSSIAEVLKLPGDPA